MKIGFTVSTVMHAAVLGAALLSLSVTPLKQAARGTKVKFATEETESAKVEAKGQDLTTPSAVPVPRPQTEAVNPGDAKTDEASRDGDKTDKSTSDMAIPAPKADKRRDEPIISADPVIAPKPKEPETAPTPEKAEQAEPEIKDIIEADSETKTEAETQLAALPSDRVPVPQSAPQRPKPNSPQTPEIRKPVEQQPTPTATSEESSDRLAEKISQELNRQNDSAQGAAANDKPASPAAGEAPKSSAPLSQGEEDGLREAIEQCANITRGVPVSQDLKIIVTASLNRDGTISGNPSVRATGGTAEEQDDYSRKMTRAVKRCAPYDFLPAEKFGTWSEVVVNFYPYEMSN
jgi:hypothetical protein